MSDKDVKWVRKNLKEGWCGRMSPEEREKYIIEVEKWLYWRSTHSKWFEFAFTALLQEIYELRGDYKEDEET